jgi:hypothetical protein
MFIPSRRLEEREVSSTEDFPFSYCDPPAAHHPFRMLPPTVGATNGLCT